MGFLYVTNHGIPQARPPALWRASAWLPPRSHPRSAAQEVIDRAYAANEHVCSNLPEDVKKTTANEEEQLKQFPWMSKARARTLQPTRRACGPVHSAVARAGVHARLERAGQQGGAPAAGLLCGLRPALDAGPLVQRAGRPRPQVRAPPAAAPSRPAGLQQHARWRREAILEFMWHNSRVADLIMRAFALGLGYEESYFQDAMSPAHDDNRTAMVRPFIMPAAFRAASGARATAVLEQPLQLTLGPPRRT